MARFRPIDEVERRSAELLNQSAELIAAADRQALNPAKRKLVELARRRAEELQISSDAIAWAINTSAAASLGTKLSQAGFILRDLA